MSEEAQAAADQRELPRFKYPEADVSPEEPWQDDVLDRAKIAEKLTNLLRNQRDPFVISIDGYWGTGKTFLLKRWQMDLEAEGFKAIYYNAWEDDFCDDPLLAIVGQLSEQFKEDAFRAIAKKAGEVAVRLIWKNVKAVIERQTGLVLDLDLGEQKGRDLLQEYLDQRETKDRLKAELTKLSAAVAEETGRPLVFIIDELDRCRPTFAIELLERVKHIFDVPDMVFVFGINRDELCKALNSVYGEIDASIYLRRFFDMEFGLPGAELQAFCNHIMTRLGLHEYFLAQLRSTDARTNATDYQNFSEALPLLCALLDLSLRDIVYCIRMVVLAIRNLEEEQYMFPWPLSLLIPLKLDDPTLYRQFIQGDCHASDVFDYIDGKLSLPVRNEQLEFELTAIEADLYLLETARLEDSGESTPRDQLELLEGGATLSYSHLLSKRTQEAGADRATELLKFIDGDRLQRTPHNAINELASLIDFHDIVAR